MPSSLCLLLLLASLTPTPAAQLCGDCDDDGFVTVLDALCTARISVRLVVPTPLQLLVCDVNGDGLINVLDAFVIAEYSVGVPRMLACRPSMPPSCSILMLPGSTVAGWVWVWFDTVSPVSAPLDVGFDFSTDGGVSWSYATPAAGSALPYDVNPALGVPPGVSQLFIWDSRLDASGVTSGLRFRVNVTDGVASTACTINLMLDNSCYCIIRSPIRLIARGDIPIDFEVVDCSSPTAGVFEYSSNGGISFDPVTPAMSSPLGNPCFGLASPGRYIFEWDSLADVTSAAAPVILRLAIFNPSASAICTTQFTVDN